MEMSKCKAFVGNSANNERVEKEKRDYGIKGIGVQACNEFVNTDVDFFRPYQPKPQNPYFQNTSNNKSKTKRDVEIVWGGQ